MTKTIIPQSLKEGDTVAIVSPAGALREKAVAMQAADTLRGWGLNVAMSPHSLSQHGYYSGSVEERTGDIIDAVNDSNIKAIFCSYGGYGCVHVVEKFAEAIKENPKWVIGMSDCTVLLAGCLNVGIASLHSPQCRHIATYPNSEATEHLRNALFGNKIEYTVPPHRLNICGAARSCLVGGNLSIICSLIGTPYNMLHNDSILLIEDTNEPLYRIERMMYQLKLSGALSKIKGLIVGQFTGTKEQPGIGSSVYDVIHNVVANCNIPVCYNFPVGHCTNNYPMIVGAVAELCVENNRAGVMFPRD